MRTRFSLILLVSGFLLTGCAPVIFTAGAGAGYVATHEEPRSKVEMFFDDLARSIRQTTRRITGGQPSQPTKAAGAATGLALKIDKSSIAPATVKPGDQVKLTLRYVITGAPKKGAQIREKSTLASGGKELTVLKDETVGKDNGIWENTLTFAVPASAKPGKYTITQLISAQGQNRSSRRSFTVQ
jgi:hypothetical protein